MQPSRNFDDLKFSSIHRRILLWGSGGPFLDGYVLVMIGVALEQLTPGAENWTLTGLACWARERSPGCSLAHRCLAISPIKSDGAKCSSLISSPSA
ncbi:major facilitator superfamily protein [Escherichia coli]|uniref:Major facilitator superfamily protein n=1 Tax=Escherichia coli TaxID=562 RepID=A0A377CY76_ECOLX|nr:major facilitator superfamily protein [Escherichia coli]